VLRVTCDLQASGGEERPLVVAGAPGLASVLRRELARGGVGEAVREQRPLEGAAALVYVLAGAADDKDRQVLRAAEQARLPTVCVVAGPLGSGAPKPPSGLGEHVIQVRSGAGLPLDGMGRALARALGETGTARGARLPV